MSEDRDLRALPEASPSGLKTVLGVTGFVAGLGLLVCGGVAVHVGWKGSPEDVSKLASAQVAKRPELQITEAEQSEIQAAGRRILLIDLLPGLEPIKKDMHDPMSSVTFGRRTGEGPLLLIGRVDFASIPADTNLDKQREFMIQELEMGPERHRTVLRARGGTKHELTVLGQPTAFEVIHAPLGISAAPVVKVTGWFSTKAARIALVFAVPEEEYDEEAVFRMIESIRPPDGDSAPAPDDSASSSAEGAAEDRADVSAEPEPGPDDKAKTGNSTPTDDN